MTDPIFVLSPPRSFSSVVSTILGQHPELHTFPELQILWWDTIDQLLSARTQTTQRRYAPPGLIRAIAFIHEQIQDSPSCARACLWLSNNRSMTTAELFDYMRDAHAPLLCIEKSPSLSKSIDRLLRLFKLYPNAKFIHLTRSVLGNSKSLKEFFEHRDAEGISNSLTSHPLRSAQNYPLMWYGIHQNILKFRSIIPASNFLTVKGESILSNPHQVLPQICRWLGISSDPLSIESMLHPEKSPYSFFGPAIAACGNDPKFITSPQFRLMKKKPSTSDSVRQYFDVEANSNFTEYFSRQTSDTSVLQQLKDYNHTIVDLILDTESQLGYV